MNTMAWIGKVCLRFSCFIDIVAVSNQRGPSADALLVEIKLVGVFAMAAVDVARVSSSTAASWQKVQAAMWRGISEVQMACGDAKQMCEDVQRCTR